MTEEIAQYYTYKMALSIPFNMKRNEYNEIYFNITVMEYLRDIIREFTKENLISKEVENNIKNYLLKAREYKDIYRKERIDIINDIIGMLNMQKEDYSLAFYIEQLCTRRNTKWYLTKASLQEIKSQIDKVHESIECDYLITGTHFDTMSDELFHKHFFENFVNSNVYFDSINMLLHQMPQLFKDPTFYNRVMTVLEAKKFFGETSSDKYIKQINKTLKKINKFKQV